MADKTSVAEAVLELAKFGRLSDETAASLGDEDAQARLKAAGRDVPGDDKADTAKASSTTKGTHS
jgi:hypothetical protein